MRRLLVAIAFGTAHVRLVKKNTISLTRACYITLSFVVLAFPPGLASASLVTFGLTGQLDGLSCPAPYDGPGCVMAQELGVTPNQLIPVTGLFTIDSDVTPTIDSTGGYEVRTFNYTGAGTGLAVTIGNLTIFADTFRVNLINDQFGGWCGAGQLRDFISVISDEVRMYFDSCSINAIYGDSLLQANLGEFGASRTGPGEYLVVNPQGGFPQFLGATTSLFRAPEPGILPLLCVGLLGVAVARLRHQ